MSRGPWTVDRTEIDSLLDRLRVARGQAQALLTDVELRQRSDRSIALEAEHDQLTQEIGDLNREIDVLLDDLAALIPKQRRASD